MPAAATDPISRYFKAVNASYEALVDAIQSASTHGNAVWSQLLDDVRAGQKDALALGEKIAAKPGDPLTYSALLEASMKAQERSLAFAKVLFEEASGVGTDGRSAFERVLTANKGVAEAATELTRSWGTPDASFAEAWRKGVEAFTAPFAATR